MAAAQPRSLASLRTPCAVVRRSVVQANCERMLERARALGVQLRPHVKTHKTVEGALLQTGGQKRTITVSTLAEAAFFAAAGFTDILYAVPITPDKLEPVGALLRGGTVLHVCVDHPDQLAPIVERASAGTESWSVVIMVDCGMHRDGVPPDDPLVEELAKAIAAAAPAVSLFGCCAPPPPASSVATTSLPLPLPAAAVLLPDTHGGHSYTTEGLEAVKRVGAAERDAVTAVARRIRDATGLELPSVGVGSTPSASNPPDHLDGVTEMHRESSNGYPHRRSSDAADRCCNSRELRVLRRDAVRLWLVHRVGHWPLHAHAGGRALPAQQHAPHRPRLVRLRTCPPVLVAAVCLPLSRKG